jgi:hypothetical protein
MQAILRLVVVAVRIEVAADAPILTMSAVFPYR